MTKHSIIFGLETRLISINSNWYLELTILMNLLIMFCWIGLTLFCYHHHLFRSLIWKQNEDNR